MKRLFGGFAAGALGAGMALALALPSCGTTKSAASSAASSIGETYDCADICEHIRDCKDASVNQDECVSTCEQRAGGSDSYAKQLDQCEECLDGLTCAEAGGNSCEVCKNVLDIR